MKKLNIVGLFIIAFFSFTSNSVAQEFKITGNIVDAVSANALESATVYLETINDSTLITYTITDKEGYFNLIGTVSVVKANIFLSFNGYKTVRRTISLKSIIDLGIIKMEEQTEVLNGIDVIGERIPIQIKKDTLEFNANSFKTRPDASVEDLLKKLPGIEVDLDGSITVNGKAVNEVLVDGQVFFSNDPRVATKALPKEIVDKVQITNTKTTTQEFMGTEGDADSKTINLVLKKDKNKGYLGRLTGAYGTDDRYQASGLLNIFKSNERISFIASSNNINNTGFSFNEIHDMMGGHDVSINSEGGFSLGGLSFGFDQGITTSSTLGASYSNAEKGEYKIAGDYFFAYSDTFNKQKTTRENFLPNSRFFNEIQSDFNGSTNSNKGSARLEFDIDDSFRITLEPKISINQTNSDNSTSSISLDENFNQINTNSTSINNNGVSREYSNRLDVIKKTDTLGSFVRAFFKNRNNENNDAGTLISKSSFLNNFQTSDDLNQQTGNENNNQNYNFGLEYSQAVSRKILLNFTHEINSNKAHNIRTIFEFDSIDSGYTVFNEALSSDFEFETVQNTSSFGIQSNNTKLRFSISSKYVNSRLKNSDAIQNKSFSKIFDNFLWQGFLRYDLGNNKNLSFDFKKTLRLPSIYEVQPVPNLNNPLNIIVGNQNLSPSTTKKFNFGYNNYNWQKKTGLFIYGGLNFHEDNISSVSEINENLVTTTTYSNIDGNYDHFLSINYSKEIASDSLLSIKFNLKPRITTRKYTTIRNSETLENISRNIEPRFSVGINYRKVLEIEPEYGISLNSSIYNQNSFEDVNFTIHNVSLSTTTYWPKKVIWNNVLKYNYNSQIGPGFEKDALFWNMSLGLQIFKERATLQLLAYDILNQNINTRRTIGQDFVQDFQGTVLRRYFLLSLTFKLNKFGKNAAPQQSIILFN